MPVISVQNSWIMKSKCWKYLAFSMQESNHKAPLFRKKTAPWIVRIKYTISWNKEQQSVAWFFPSRFFWSLFFPHEITVALFSLRKFKITNVKLNFLRENKATVISFGKKRLLKKIFCEKILQTLLLFISLNSVLYSYYPGRCCFFTCQGCFNITENIA